MRYFLLIIGLGTAGMGLHMVYKRLAFMLRTRKTVGRLTGWEERPGFGASRRVVPVVYYFAEVAFEGPDGVERTVTSASGFESTGRQSIGDPVSVRYDPRNPDDARVDTAVNLWIQPVAFLLIGGVVLLASVYARH
jgi:hypothetical protein